MQVSDITELSTDQEFIVANRVYNAVCNQRPWQFLKTQASGSILSDSLGYYIDAPADFSYFSINNTLSSNAWNINNNTDAKVIFVGDSYCPYQIINWSDRRQYRKTNGFAYFDASTNKIRFTETPIAFTYEFDYIKNPAPLVSGDTPIIPTRFQDVIAYGMAVDDAIIQMSPKATSYAAENQVKYNNLLQQMKMWDANLQMM